MEKLVQKLQSERETDIIQRCGNEGALQRESEPGVAAANAQEASTRAALENRRVSPPHRPLTRSQTGRVSKRRRPNDTPPPEVRKRAARAPKKNKPASEVSSKSLNPNAPKDKGVMPTIPHRELSLTPSSDTSPLNATQLIFLDSSSSSTMDTSVDRPGPKSRATLPVPVPNLTKKSRGRRVPTRLPNDDSPKDTRMYVCKVESCGKCFHRGEHLKRHIRSIHTHEKPFKCTYPLCNKHFNRHDNLLQHLKVHKELATSESSAADDTGSPIQLHQSTPSPLSIATPPQLQPYYPAHEAYEASMKQARMATIYQPPTSSFRAYAAPYGSPSEPVSFATNMAVSSLRTEIPQSPPTSRRQI
ncbi:hypothetical protein D9615_000982 [Tricholomella constricta]|uniref:C2H2-type domain-containing protein n=1 Tax=Tricholomella constricta TaxID=117010 RepID=A0A8H5HKI1_9AGAR|nr:hypothetical protein D9615_000982 [Tricholomella constricta]